MNDTITPKPRSRWKAALLLVLVFSLGAACGVGGGLLVLRNIIQRAIKSPRSDRAPIDQVLRAFERELSSSLDLSAAERAQLHEDFRVISGEFKELRVEVWQKARGKCRESLDRVTSHLPPEKATKLRERAVKRLKPWGLLE